MYLFSVRNNFYPAEFVIIIGIGRWVGRLEQDRGNDLLSHRSTGDFDWLKEWSFDWMEMVGKTFLLKHGFSLSSSFKCNIIFLN